MPFTASCNAPTASTAQNRRPTASLADELGCHIGAELDIQLKPGTPGAPGAVIVRSKTPLAEEQINKASAYLSPKYNGKSFDRLHFASGNESAYVTYTRNGQNFVKPEPVAQKQAAWVGL